MSYDPEPELVAAIQSRNVIRTARGLFSLRSPKLAHYSEYLSLTNTQTGIVDFSPEDQVVTVRTGTMLGVLQTELARHGQCIPHKFPLRFNNGEEEIGNLIDFNLPHALEGLCGTWRDWILGMRVILADGKVCTCGSHAVKNVAGYDVQKLFIGARGTLGIISQITLRTYPVKAVPQRPSILGTDNGNHPIYIHRTTRDRLEALISEAGPKMKSADPITGTIWAGLAPDEQLSRQQGDWILRSMCGEKNLELTDPTQIRLMKRAKEIFDPTYKLNPGEMGIF
jgi:FAD/FMN-containing dehydrogenase